MADVIARKRRGAIVVAIRTTEWAEGLFPFRSVVELIGVGEGMARFVAQVHHDFSRVFEVMRFFFQLRQRGVRQIKGNPDNRLARGTSPLIGQITSRAE